MESLKLQRVDDLAKMLLDCRVRDDSVRMRLGQRDDSFFGPALTLQPARTFRSEEEHDDAKDAEGPLE